jgi:predicted ATPase
MKHGDHDALRLLQAIKLENFLSFGPDNAPLQLGPNAAGKSNLIEALSVIRSTPVSATASYMDLRGVLRRGGGASEWVRKREKGIPPSIEVNYPKGSQPPRHVLSFRGDEPGFHLDDERIENEAPGNGERDPYFYYRYQSGHPVVNTKAAGKRRLARETVSLDVSVLAQRRDPE